MQQLYGFASKETLYTALDLFLTNLKCRKEAVPSSLDAFLDYFCNWYKRNASRLKARLKASDSLKNYGMVLWGKCMSAFEKIVSESVFTSIFRQLAFESYDASKDAVTETSQQANLREVRKQLYRDIKACPQ